MITIEVKDGGVLAALRKLVNGLDDMTPAMADIAQALASESERQFATESGPLGRWPDLSDYTKAFRSEKGTWPGRMLQVSAGGLAASVQTAHGEDFAMISSNKPYSAMQQFGGTTSPNSMIPGKTIPARPYLPFHPETLELSEPAQQTVLEVLQGWLSGLAKE
jgi:phage virion morphogenesis protein